MTRFRRYELSDRDACLAIFDSNCPEYLHPEERPTFEAWLKEPQGTYLVLENDKTVLGCAGYIIEQDSELLSLTWGLLHADSHGRKLGMLMLLERLLSGIADTQAKGSRLATTPQVEPFFAKVGYRRLKFIPNGWGPSMDKVEMRLDFTPNVIADLRKKYVRSQDKKHPTQPTPQAD